MNYETERRNKNRGYMKLIVWQKGMELFELIWTILFRQAKIDFRLRSQIADAAQPVPANISEGYGRRSLNEYIHFLYYALGTMAETMTRAIGLRQTKQVPDARFNDFDVLHYEVENRLLRLIEKLEQRKDDDDWIARIAEDPEEYSTTPLLHHSITPAPAHA
ncbi:MAG: four helix bundle protein [Chthoniobacterales bacterium]